MTSKAFVSLHLVLALLLPAWAGATCIPRADGVPGTLLWQQQPNWWDSTPGFPRYNTSLSDPRWRGATAQGFPVPGTGVPKEQVTFRALHRTVGSKTYLYLSWEVEVAPALTPNKTRFFVGFRDPGTAGKDVVLDLETTSTADTTAGMAYSARVWTKDSTMENWTTISDADEPAWITETTRVWIENSPKSWAVQMRVPVTAGTDLNNGVSLDPGTPFRMWYEVRVAAPSEPECVIAYRWPACEPPDLSCATDPLLGTPPPTTNDGAETWAEFRLTNAAPGADPACPTTGVTFTASDIGTTNTPPSKINLNLPNTLFASPTNQSASDVNVRARFRIANWGTQAISLHSPFTPWEDIADPAGEPSPPGLAIGAGATGTIQVPWTLTECERCEFQSYYDDHTAACDMDCPGLTADKKFDHQCLLVELSGPGVTFLTQSVYRNMTFAEASRFEREAEVNIAGLEPHPLGQPERDVYLYVETFNMPRTVEEGDEPENGDGQGNEARAGCDCDPLEDEDRHRMRTEPTYLVHAYVDSGERMVSDGVEHPVLRPMTSYGYFVRHQGELTGWRHALEGAEEVSPGFYRVRVPEGGSTTVKDVIEALEEPEETGRDRFRISLHGGFNTVTGSFGDQVETGLSIGVDFEYSFRDDLALELFAGFDDFKTQLGGDEVLHLSLNLKAYRSLNDHLRGFALAGLGLYEFDSGPSENGFNLGAGVRFALRSGLWLDTTARYHVVDVGDSDFTFLTAQWGVSFDF